MNEPGTKTLPASGREAKQILRTMRALRDQDVDWEEGRALSLVYEGRRDLCAFVEQAYRIYFSENARDPSAFPSLRRMEREVVAMTASMLGGGPGTVGTMTSGGTESILMALKTAREWTKSRDARNPRPEVILPQTAHPAFDKAAHYLGLELIKTPVRGDYRADVRAMRRAITRRTVMLVGSAPQHAQGVVDPIAEIADLAAARGLLCHVDACVGGFMLPFVRTLGRPVPAFDFNVPGVTSMSADLHKYGWAAKGASVVLYHAPELRKLQFFATTDWPGGIYASPSMTGTRPGGAIAAAWAVMNRLGWEGYTEIAGEIMGAVDAIRDGISRLEGVSVMGDPHMSVFALQTDEVDPYEVADGLAARGWHIERQHSPPCLHLSVNGLHVGQTDAFLADLRSALGEVEPPTIAQRVLSLGRDVLLKAAASVLPRRVVSSAMDATSGRIVIDLLDQMTRYQPDEEIQFDELGERVEALALEEPVPEELFTVRTIRLEQAEPYRPTKRALRRALRRRLRRPMTLDAAIRVDEEHPHGLEEPLQRPLRLHDGPRHGHRP